jgi:hypothetical protein
VLVLEGKGFVEGAAKGDAVVNYSSHGDGGGRGSLVCGAGDVRAVALLLCCRRGVL